MRFLKKDLKSVYVYKPKEKESGYVGKIKELELSHKFFCIISPISSKIEAEAYGERIFQMNKIMCAKNEDIKEGYGISIKSSEKAEYKVVSVMEYTYHKEALVELIL